MQTKYDITGWGPYLFVALLVMVLFSFVLIFIPTASFPWIHKLMSGLFALIFCVYIVYDVQLICGGKSHQLSVDDYCFAALMLYIDIVQLFLQLLALFGDWAIFVSHGDT